MWNPIEQIRLRRARRRYVPRAPRVDVGTTAKLALVALALILAVAAVLEMRGGGVAERELLPYAEASHIDPLELIATAGRRHRLVFLGDVPAAAAPKTFAARALERIAGESGLDAVAVEIPADEQPYLDRYFLTTPEDASLLLSRPRAIREAEGVSRSYLELYRTIWRLNSEMTADRAIRVIAMDPPRWPPERALSPNRAGELYGERDAFMEARLDSLLLERNARARVLFFVEGLRVMRGGAALQTGGTGLVEITWLAQRMRDRFPRDVYGVLVDAPASRALAPEVVAYRSSGAWDVLRQGVPDAPAQFGLPVTEAFDPIGAPVRVFATPGTTFSLQPGGELRELVDAYILLR